VYTLLALGGGTSWFRGSLEIQQSVDRLMLSQGPSTVMRIALYAWPLVVLLGAFLCYRTLFTSQTSTFTCERASGKCRLDGNDAPALADIKGVELDTTYRGKEGRFYYPTLLLRDGGKFQLTQQGAQKDSVIADYRATVKAIEGFLGGSEPRLETSFTYRAGTWEKVYSVGTLAGSALLMFVILGMAMTRTYTFDKAARKIELVDHRPLLGDKTRELAFGEVTLDHQGQAVELVLKDNSRVMILDQDEGNVAKQLGELLK
jgi:hypothetical protein